MDSILQLPPKLKCTHVSAPTYLSFIDVTKFDQVYDQNLDQHYLLQGLRFNVNSC